MCLLKLHQVIMLCLGYIGFQCETKFQGEVMSAKYMATRSLFVDLLVKV